MTTNLTEADTSVYHIVMKKLISTPSASNIMATSTKVTVGKPSDVQLSSQPLSGRFEITCPLENNDIASNPITTGEYPFNDHITHIPRKIS
jgi:hypothetical protein